MLRYLALIPLCVVTAGSACAQARPSSARTGPPLRLAYGPDREQFRDLYLPEGRGPIPVIVLLHGGCLVARMGTLDMLGPLADSLRRAGFAVWNVEYRRVDSPGGGWPQTFRDPARATDHLRSLAKRFSLDTTRVIAVGHSAGGFLALWLGARTVLKPEATLHATDPLPLQAVVSLGADGDLPRVAPDLERECGVPVGARLFGTDSSTRKIRLSEAHPADMPPSRTRQLLIVGDRDEGETAALREGYVARARAKGESIELVLVPGVSHMGIVDPTGAAWAVIRDRLRALLGAPEE